MSAIAGTHHAHFTEMRRGARETDASAISRIPAKSLRLFQRREQRVRSRAAKVWQGRDFGPCWFAQGTPHGQVRCLT